MDKDKIAELMAALDNISGMISDLRDSISGDDPAAEPDMEAEQAMPEEAGPPMASEDTPDKQLKKSAAIAMLRKSLPQ